MSLNAPGFLFAATAILWVLQFLASVYVVRRAQALSALPDQLQRSYDSRMRLLAESHEEMRETVDRLADQVKMMNVRAKITHGTRSKKGDEPDPQTDPDGWRQWMNRKINRQKAGLDS